MENFETYEEIIAEVEEILSIRNPILRRVEQMYEDAKNAMTTIKPEMELGLFEEMVGKFEGTYPTPKSDEIIDMVHQIEHDNPFHLDVLYEGKYHTIGIFPALDDAKHFFNENSKKIVKRMTKVRSYNYRTGDSLKIYDFEYPEINDILIKSGMKATAFSDYLQIPYRTVQNWREGRRECPRYLIDLIIYKLEHSGKM